MRRKKLSCPDIRHLELFLSSQLSRDEKLELEEHLKSCEQCSHKLEEMRENQTFLQYNKNSLNSLDTVQANVFSQDRARMLIPEKFSLIGKIRQGNDSCVFKAYDLDLDRPVAVKFLFKEAINFDNWWSEDRIVAKLHHSNIVLVYEAQRKDGIVYIVMEWFEGRSIVDSCLKLPIDRKIKVFQKVLEAMSCVHQKNIVHMDIKPSNILVNSILEPKILDFGISVECHMPDSSGSYIYKGSPPYSSPEQIPPLGPITPATDIFSLGIVLYQLITDKLPFPQESYKELFRAIEQEQPKLPTLINPSIPKEIERICLKAINKAPDQRYPDAGAMSQDIQRYLDRSLKQRDKNISANNQFYLSGSDTFSFELPLSEGYVLGNYKIINKLGHGIVDTYLASNIATNQERVIKIIISSNPESKKNLNKFISECGLQDKISDYSHIIKLFDPQVVNLDALSLIIFSMEYADAGNLGDWFNNSIDQNERLSDGIDLFLQACRGITTSHARGSRLWNSAEFKKFII